MPLCQTEKVGCLKSLYMSYFCLFWWKNAETTFIVFFLHIKLRQDKKNHFLPFLVFILLGLEYLHIVYYTFCWTDIIFSGTTEGVFMFLKDSFVKWHPMKAHKTCCLNMLRKKFRKGDMSLKLLIQEQKYQEVSFFSRLLPYIP